VLSIAQEVAVVGEQLQRPALELVPVALPHSMRQVQYSEPQLPERVQLQEQKLVR
jgi:hypothetical protein